MTQDRQLHPRMWSSGLGKKDSPLVCSQLQLPGLLPGVTVLAWTCSAGHSSFLQGGQPNTAPWAESPPQPWKGPPLATTGFDIKQGPHL